MIAYSDKKPTEPGYYWMKCPSIGKCIPETETVAKIYECNGHLFHFTQPVANMHGRLFAGPIDRPGKLKTAMYGEAGEGGE